MDSSPRDVQSRSLQEQVAEVAQRHQAFQPEYQIRMVTHEGTVDRLEASSGEWHPRRRQSQTIREATQQQIQRMAQAIQRDTLERLTLLESKYQEQISVLQRQLQGLSNKDARTSNSSSEHLHEIQSLRNLETRKQGAARASWEGPYDLRLKLRLVDSWHSELLNQKEIQDLKAQAGVIASQTPTETPWWLVSEKVNAEIDRVLSILSTSSPRAQDNQVTWPELYKRKSTSLTQRPHSHSRTCQRKWSMLERGSPRQMQAA